MADDASSLLVPCEDPRLAPPVTKTGRRRFTLDDMTAMLKAGVLEEGERTELIDGEFFPMASEGEAHRDDARDLYSLLSEALGKEAFIEMRGPLNVAEATQLAPDLAVWPAHIRGRDMFADKVLLVIEISDTTRRKDLGRKALTYAVAGVPEYWVFDVVDRRLWVHRGPHPDGWRERFLLTAPQISPLCAPDAVVDLTTLCKPQ